MAIARIAVSSLEPNPNPEPVEGADVVDAPTGPHPAPPAPSAATSASAPTIPPPPGKRRRGRPPKNRDGAQPLPVAPRAPRTPRAPAQAGTGPTEAELAARSVLDPFFAKVGKLAVLGAREGKDLATFVHELRDAIAAYDELLKKL